MSQLLVSVITFVQAGRGGRRRESVLFSAMRRIAGRFTDARRRHAALRELAGLDDRTLRDMSLTRSELESAVAESMGKAARTRVCVPPRAAQPHQD